VITDMFSNLLKNLLFTLIFHKFDKILCFCNNVRKSKNSLISNFNFNEKEFIFLLLSVIFDQLDNLRCWVVGNWHNFQNKVMSIYVWHNSNSNGNQVFLPIGQAGMLQACESTLFPEQDCPP
jgi:hypothetical protein